MTQIRFFPVVAMPPLLLAEDRPTLRQTADGGVRLEVTARKGTYAIELSPEEAERIAELTRTKEGKHA